MMLHIDADDDLNIMEEDDEDAVRDTFARKFFDDLKKVGPYSKQILNYSYPPLLY
jgi:hypothetical protein